MNLYGSWNNLNHKHLEIQETSILKTLRKMVIVIFDILQRCSHKRNYAVLQL